MAFAIVAGTLRYYHYLAGPAGALPENASEEPSPWPGRPAFIEGTVLSSAGSIVAGAEVFLIHDMTTDLIQVMAKGAGRLPAARVAAQGTTSPAGSFGIQSPVTDGKTIFELHVRAPGHVVHRQSLLVAAEHRQILPPITLEKGRTLQGTVRDKNTKAGIAGATLRAKPMCSNWTIPTPGLEDGVETTSDASGRYTLSGLAEGPFDLMAFARGYGRVSRPDVVFADNEETRSEDLELDVGMTIQGWVVGSDNVLLAGADVTATAWRDSMLVTDVTGKDGRFTLLDLADGAYRLTARATGYVKGERKVIRAGARDVPVVLEGRAPSRYASRPRAAGRSRPTPSRSSATSRARITMAAPTSTRCRCAAPRAASTCWAASTRAPTSCK